MTLHHKIVPLTALICGGLISGCSAQDNPGAAPVGAQPAAAALSATNGNAETSPKNIFQPSAIDPALVRQSMQARSEYEEMNRKVTARMNALYQENPEIKELQAQMRTIQKKIDALLAEDEELANLKKKYQAVAPEIPQIPRKADASVSPAPVKTQKP